MQGIKTSSTYVNFSYKDYKCKQGAVKKEMILDALEFIRRFAMHILPKGFVRIRHYGILSSTSKSVNASIIKDQLPLLPGVIKKKERREIFNPKKCPCCKKETMLTIQQFNRRGPPSPDWEDEARNILDCLN